MTLATASVLVPEKNAARTGSRKREREKKKKVFTFISALIDKSWGVLLVDSQLSLSAGQEKERGGGRKAWVQMWDNASSVDSDLACGD